MPSMMRTRELPSSCVTSSMPSMTRRCDWPDDLAAGRESVRERCERATLLTTASRSLLTQKKETPSATTAHTATMTMEAKTRRPIADRGCDCPGREHDDRNE